MTTAIKISEKSMSEFNHNKNVVGIEQKDMMTEPRQSVKIIVRKGEFGLPEFISNDVVVGRIYTDSYHKGKYTGDACLSSINNATLPEVLDYLQDIIHGNLLSKWGLVADFEIEV